MRTELRPRSTNNSSAREAILESIRAHLSSSKKLDAREGEITHKTERVSGLVSTVITDATPVVDLFKASLEEVDGHCLIVHDETELVRTLTDILRNLRQTRLSSLRVAVSDSAEVRRLTELIDLDLDEVAVTPSAADVFSFDVGISGAQAGIAETGTLLLDSSRERHRLVSLVPPVHIAILDASQIVSSLGEALALMRKDKTISPIVTLVTGPSRTADIELTLAIGVHGPQELFVIIRT
jgi:L-lactate dehydrogenase complex protein LldG